MINQAMHLREDVFEGKEKAATRDGFGRGVIEAGEADERVIVLSADVASSIRADGFQKEFPERFVEVGVAEQNLATVAAGMATYGKIPFIAAYAAFSPGRNWEQIRTTIALNNVPVKVCGMHVGLLTGPDGATHQALEDIALMRSLPNMIVISACDSEQGRKATLAAAQTGKPAYLRFGRDKTPVMTTPETPFEIGKAEIFWKSDAPRVAVFATGPLVHSALLAARELDEEGIGTTVVNVHTIKPLDKETVVAVAREAGSVVTIEDHQVTGGLGGAIAELLARECPTPMEFLGIQDKFGQSGDPKDLIEFYGLGVSHITAAIKRASEK
jgi:transketolase